MDLPAVPRLHASFACCLLHISSLQLTNRNNRKICLWWIISSMLLAILLRIYINFNLSLSPGSKHDFHKIVPNSFEAEVRDVRDSWGNGSTTQFIFLDRSRRSHYLSSQWIQQTQKKFTFQELKFNTKKKLFTTKLKLFFAFFSFCWSVSTKKKIII